jgi:hypothetical protein
VTATVRRLLVIVAAVVLAAATLAPSAGAAGGQKVDVKFEQLQGFNAPGTPAKYNKVGVIKTGPSDAENVLVLVPGTSASAADFEPLARTSSASRRAGRPGRSSAGRTSSRTTRC